MAKDCTSILRVVQLLLLISQATQALRWTPVANNGSKSHICAGDNFTFPWTYVTENDDKIIVLFWFSDKNGSFASYFADTFTSSSRRVTYHGNAKMTLSDVREEDDDTYGVSIRLYGKTESVTKHARLTVVEPPKARDGELQVTELSQNSSHAGSTSHLHKWLKCGEFLSLGLPPVSVTWTDPLARRLPSSSFADGFFYLDLPPYAKGGNYTCSLDPDAEATKCLSSDSPLRMEASFLLETMETEIRDQAEDLQELKTELKELREKTLGFKVVDTNLLRIQELAGRVDELEAKGDNLTQETESQKLLDDARDKTQQESLQSLQDTVNDLKEKTHQEVQAGLDNLNIKLNEMTQTLTQHQTTDTQHSSSIDDILRRLNDVEKASERQTIVNGNLQNELSKLQQVSEQQKDKISTLQQETAELKEANEELKMANMTLSLKLEDVQARNQALYEELRDKTNILTNRVQTEERTRTSSSATMQNQLEAISQTLTLNSEQLNLKVSALKQEITELTEVDEALKTANETLNQRLEDVQTSSEASYKELREKTNILTNRVQMEEQTRARSSTQLQTRLDELTASQQESIRDLREKSERLKSGHDNLTQVLQDDTETLRGLVTEQHTLKEKSKRCEEDYQVLSQTTEGFRDTLGELTQRLQAEEQTLANSSAGLQTQLDDLSEMLTQHTSTASTTQAATDSQLSQVKQNLALLTTSSHDAVSRLGDVEDQLERLQQSVSENITRAMQTMTGSGELPSSVEESVRSLQLNVSQGQRTLATLQRQFVEFRTLSFKLRESGAQATLRAVYGQGAGPIVLDDVVCTGSELDIRLCPATTFGSHNCNHGEDAGVVCQP
ncbi:hypothetical protein BaRGS_00029322 [Batillaria attramentaria]|uniref:Uncharacterized protein n=1 Tax=Batillaria attramentaria TaxID=370345 RepID=A0ABD0JWC9_9CAEN